MNKAEQGADTNDKISAGSVDEVNLPNDQPPSLAQRWLRKLKLCLLTMMAAYLIIVTVLVINEPYLVYPGSKYPRGNWTPENFEFEEVSFYSSDGTEIFAWYLPCENADATVLLCHGNAENIAQSSAYVGEHLRTELNADVFVFDYRGYGKSEGKPFEKGVLADSEAALEFLCGKVSKRPDEIVILGHSIGGGPATHLASKSGAKALVLQRTFSSLVDAAGRQYPWVPVKYLMKNRYPSAEKIKEYDGPVFQSHGDKDTVVNIESARDLYAAAPTQSKYFFEVEGMGHFDRLPDAYWKKLNEFIRELPTD